jgi:hypothetical protein
MKSDSWLCICNMGGVNLRRFNQNSLGIYLGQHGYGEVNQHRKRQKPNTKLQKNTKSQPQTMLRRPVG